MQYALASTLAAMAAVTASSQAAIVNLVASLSARQEVPTNSSTAFGCARMTVDTDANTVTYRIAFTGLSATETAAHFHGPAAVGANAPVVFGLGTGNPKVGVWTYPESIEADILGGRFYINIHTTAFPGGEIRGQVCSMVAEIDGLQEVPPSPSAGLGTGIFMIDTTANTLSYDIRFSGLLAAETAAHIHGFSNYQVNSGIQHPLPAGSPKIGVWNYPEDMEQAILDGLCYVNIHSAAFGGGEIRGQIIASVNPMDSRQEVPVNTSTAGGCAMCAINRDLNTYGYDMKIGGLGSTQTAAHIHGFSAAGTNSGVQHSVDVGTRRRGVWTYPEVNELQILQGFTYFNAHTVNFPGGEIRGQTIWVVAPPAPPCRADFNGDNQVDFFDYLDFASAFDAEDPSADFNGDNQVDFFDYLDFAAAFDAGCE
jgi:hypothetical protein